MGFIQDLKDEFNASDNNTSNKYSENELFTGDNKKEHFFKKLNFKFAKKTTDKLEILDYILLVLGGPFAQLYYRIIRFRGSLDKYWLFFPLFWIPPFSAIPTYYISKGKIKEGWHNINLFDILSFIPMGGVFISYLITAYYPEFSIVSIIPTIGSIFLAFFLRDRNRCVSTDLKKTARKTLFSAMLMSSLSVILDFLIKIFFSAIPFIGPLFKMMYSLPLLASIMYVMVTYLSYITTNMINNTSSIIGKFCKKRNKRLFIGLTMVTVLLNIIKIAISSMTSE